MVHAKVSVLAPTAKRIEPWWLLSLSVHTACDPEKRAVRLRSYTIWQLRGNGGYDIRSFHLQYHSVGAPAGQDVRHRLRPGTQRHVGRCRSYLRPRVEPYDAGEQMGLAEILGLRHPGKKKKDGRAYAEAHDNTGGNQRGSGEYGRLLQH